MTTGTPAELSPGGTRGTESQGERAGPLRAEPGCPWALLPADWHATSGPEWQDHTQAPSMGGGGGEGPGQAKPPRPERSLAPSRENDKSYLKPASDQPVLARVWFFLSHSSLGCFAHGCTGEGRNSFDGPRCKASASGNLSSDHPSTSDLLSTRGWVETDRERITDTCYIQGWETTGRAWLGFPRGKPLLSLGFLLLLCAPDTAYYAVLKRGVKKGKEKNQCPPHRRRRRGSVGW